MLLPSAIHDHINTCLGAMRQHPEHHLPPHLRLALYRALDTTLHPPPTLNIIRGQLALRTAQFVLPIWQQVLPIWPDIPDDWPDPNMRAQRLIATLEGLFTGVVTLEQAWDEANDQCYALSNLYEEFTEYRSEYPESVTLAQYYACHTALLALFEALNQDLFARLPAQGYPTDDTLTDQFCDCAASAARAYVSDPNMRGGDIHRRRIFWEWWLMEAVPQAWEYAQR